MVKKLAKITEQFLTEKFINWDALPFNGYFEVSTEPTTFQAAKSAFTARWLFFRILTIQDFKNQHEPDGNYKRTLARAMCLVNLRIIIFIYGPLVEARKSLYVLLVRKSGTGELPPFAKWGVGGVKKHTREKCAEFIMTYRICSYLFSFYCCYRYFFGLSPRFGVINPRLFETNTEP